MKKWYLPDWVSLSVMTLVLILTTGWVFATGGIVHDGIKQSSPGTATATVEQELFPCLKFDLRRDAGSYTRMHNVEIKASTNNFLTLVYFVKTWVANADSVTGVSGSLTADDDDYYLFVNDPQAGGDRKLLDWERAPVHTDLDGWITDADSRTDVMYLWPSRTCEFDPVIWMNKTNVNLRWSYIGYDTLGAEVNSDNAEQIWNEVEPVGWFKERRAP